MFQPTYFDSLRLLVTNQADYDRQGRDEQTASHGEHEVNRQGMAFKAGSPLCSRPFSGLTHDARCGKEFLFDYFEPSRGATLERFSDRNEQSEVRSKRQRHRNDSRKTGSPAAFRGRRARHQKFQTDSASDHVGWKESNTKALPLAAKPLHSTARSRYSVFPNLATARSFSQSGRSLDSGISNASLLVNRVDEPDSTAHSASRGAPLWSLWLARNKESVIDRLAAKRMALSAKWMRIWCVRPVSSRHSISV